MYKKLGIKEKLIITFLLDKDTCIAYRVEPGYNDIDLSDNPSITSGIM